MPKNKKEIQLIKSIVSFGAACLSNIKSAIPLLEKKLDDLQLKQAELTQLPNITDEQKACSIKVMLVVMDVSRMLSEIKSIKRSPTEKQMISCYNQQILAIMLEKCFLASGQQDKSASKAYQKYKQQIDASPDQIIFSLKEYEAQASRDVNSGFSINEGGLVSPIVLLRSTETDIMKLVSRADVLLQEADSLVNASRQKLVDERADRPANPIQALEGNKRDLNTPSSPRGEDPNAAQLLGAQNGKKQKRHP